MPRISRFYGILIQIFFRDQNPPHFHVMYTEYKASIAIHDLSLLSGSLPPKAFGMVVEWPAMHKDQLLTDW